MAITFRGKKNQLPVKCKTLPLLSWLLRLEDDDTVTRYFEPQMEMSAPSNGKNHMLPIHIIAWHIEGPSSFIAIIARETKQLFDDDPGVLESIRKHCGVINGRYVPICLSNTDTSWAREYLRKRRAAQIELEYQFLYEEFPT